MNRLYFETDGNYVVKIENAEISVFSRITNRYLKPYIRGGYRIYKMNGKHKLEHHLIAEHYFGKRPENLCVNHKDGNKLNNDISNLEYVTWSENTKHSYQTGLHTIAKDRKNSPKYIDGRCDDRDAYKREWYLKNRERILEKLRNKTTSSKNA